MTFAAATYATLPFGSIPDGYTESTVNPFTIVSADADTEQTCLVRFSEPPQQLRYLAPGSALVTTWWNVTGGSVNPRVLVIERTDELTVLRVCVSRPWERVTYTISALSPPLGSTGNSGIWSATGRILVTPTGTYSTWVPVQFNGVVAAVADRQLGTDLLSNPTGAVEMATSGDYQRGTAVQYAQKRIMRIISYRPGSLKYNPNYGVGLIEKRQYGATELPALKQRIIAAVSREPDIVVTNVQLRVQDGVLYCTILATLRSGEPVSVEYRQGGN